MSTYNLIYDKVRQIPQGKVATYGQIAELAGLFGKARLVGSVSYTHLPSPRDLSTSRMPSSA